MIPLRSWVRRLSSAQQYDKLVAEAIEAGGVRRGYLKGVGEAKDGGTTTRKPMNPAPLDLDTHPLSRLEITPKRIQPPLADRRPQLGHQRLEERQVVPA